MPELTDGQLMILVTAIAGVVTTLITHGYSLYRDRRNRKWDLEDRARAREEAREERRKLEEKLEENTAISQGAFRESNDFNRKLADLSRQFMEVRKDVTQRRSKGRD